MAAFANMLPSQLGRPVVDATGLTAKCNMMLAWAAESRVGAEPEADQGPTLYTAIQEQLGLMLVVDKA
jgi:uncharacterized protein (TIGR03435 family)